MSVPEEVLLTLTVKGGEVRQQELAKAAELGFDTGEIAEKLNRLTKLLEGLDVKVNLYLFPKIKRYYVEVTPPNTTELLLRKAGASGPSGDPAHKKVGDLKLKDVVEVAVAKKHQLNTLDLKKAVKTVLGSARSIGLTVEGQDPKELSKRVEEGLFDDVLREYQKLWEEF